jgi:pyridoxine kinase
VITSVRVHDDLVVYGSTLGSDAFEIRVPWRDMTLGGTGDIFTAIVTAHMSLGFPLAVSRAVHTVQAILDKTPAGAKELSLLPSAAEIISPSERYPMNKYE